MRREFWTGLTILIYALLALGFTFSLLREPPVVSYAQSAEVLSESSVKFISSSDSLDPNEVFVLANHARVNFGNKKLNANERLGALAAHRASDMTAKQYYAHKNPEGKFYYDYFNEFYINTDYSCENLDLVFAPTPEIAINEWLASTKGHRDCLVREDLVAAGYATSKLTLTDYLGQPTTAYLVVAIHSTKLN